MLKTPLEELFPVSSATAPADWGSPSSTNLKLCSVTPCFLSLPPRPSKSVQDSKGLGSGFKGTEVPGSKHNDPFIKKDGGGLTTSTNWSGGVQGGITNGQDIFFRWAGWVNMEAVLMWKGLSWSRIGFKSPATISQAQETAQYDGTPGYLAARGRHDPCVVPRAVPIVEAMAAIVVLE